MVLGDTDHDPAHADRSDGAVGHSWSHEQNGTAKVTRPTEMGGSAPTCEVSAAKHPPALISHRWWQLKISRPW